MLTIGLTGGTGFIGQHYLRENAPRHHYVVATKQADRPAAVAGYFQHDHIRYVPSDFSLDSLQTIFRGCQAVVNLAATRPTSRTEQAFSHYLTNIALADALFQACVHLHITNIVNVSTRSVYPASNDRPFREDSPLQPLNLYGVAKLCIENIAGIYNRRHGLCIKSLRLAQVIGMGERTGMLSVFLERCLRQESLDVYGAGQSAREYIYIKDVCQAIGQALAQGELSGSFNISSGESISNLEMARLFCDVFANRAGYRLLPEIEEDGFASRLDISKARADLNFLPAYSIRAAIADIRDQLTGQKDAGVQDR